MKLFTVGPVEPYPEINTIYKQTIPYFRTEEYGNLVKINLFRLSEFLHSPKGNMIYLTSSGTAAMEATIENCLNKTDKVLIINGGTFGHRFCELCMLHHIPFTPINLSYGEKLEQQHLEKFDNKGYTALLVNLHETSTGQLYNVKFLKDFCVKNGMYFIVDAIGTFLADEYNMSANFIDVSIFSSQKGLCLSPGLSFVSVSKRMKNRILSNHNSSTYYFNFKKYFENMERGQTPFTPAVNIMYELKEILDLIEKIGIKNWLKIIEEKCKYFRQKARAIGFEIPNTYSLSNMLTPVISKNIDAYQIFYKLQEYGIYVNPCGEELSHKLFRVSHIGNTTLSDIDDLLIKIQIVIKKLKQ